MSAVLDRFDIQALSQSELVDGAKSVIDQLRRWNLKFGLITNSGRAGVKMAIEKLGLSGCFDIVVTRNDIERIKPSGESVQKAVSTLGMLQMRLHTSETAGQTSWLRRTQALWLLQWLVV